MTDRIEIPKGDAGDDGPVWWPWLGLVMVTCGECGQSLRLEHDIDDDGVVSPSLDCPLCNWHVHARLTGGWCSRCRATGIDLSDPSTPAEGADCPKCKT